MFNRLVDANLRPHGLSLALIGPIMLLSWKGSMLQRDLVKASAVKQPAMVALLDKLEAMALIARTPSSTDRRAALVQLTARGLDAAGGGVPPATRSCRADTFPRRSGPSRLRR